MPKKNSFNLLLVVVLSLLSLLPLLILPRLDNPLVVGKSLLFVTLGLVGVASYFINALKQGKWTFSLSPLLLPALALIVFTVTSNLLNFRYPAQQFLGMGGSYISLALLVIFLPNLLNKGDAKKLIAPLNIVASILSVLSIFQVFGLGLSSLLSKMTVFTIPNDLSFSLTGSSLLAFTFLSAVLVANIVDRNTLKSSILAQITVFLTVIAGAINVWASFFNPETAVQLLPLSASLSIAKSSLSQSLVALFGYGSESYVEAYNQFKPVWINGQDYWQFSFGSASNQPLTLLVTGGLLSLLAWLALIWQSLKLLFKERVIEGLEDNNRYLASFIIMLIVWLFVFPANVVSLSMLAVAMAFLVAENKNQFKEFNFSAKRLLSVLPESKTHQVKKSIFVIFSIAALLLVALAASFYVRAAVASSYIYQANANLLDNQAVQAFTHLQKAKEYNPYSPVTRRSLSSLNLEVAIALSNKTDLSAAEQEQVMQLLNEAVGEANAAVVLNPRDYQSYMVLANLYSQLIGVSEEAVSATYEALAKASSYNPADPNIRMQLGQLMFSLEMYQEAATFFAQAAEYKADLAAAHYWNAKSLEALKQYAEAKTAYLKTLTLLENGSEDYNKVNQEFESMQALAKEADANSNPEAQMQAGQEELPPQASDLMLSPEQEQANNSGLSELINQEEANQLVNEEEAELP